MHFVQAQGTKMVAEEREVELETELLAHMIIAFLVFTEIMIPFPQQFHNSVSTNTTQGS